LAQKLIEKRIWCERDKVMGEEACLSRQPLICLSFCLFFFEEKERKKEIDVEICGLML